MLRIAVIVTILSVSAGCTSVKLHHSVTDQATTLMDLHYQQVLNNLAQFSANPNALPSHVQIKEGSAQIQDFGQLALLGQFGRLMGAASAGSPTLTGSRTVVEQWGVSPVTDDVEVQVLQTAYQRALGIPVLMSFELCNDLARELGKQTSESSDIDLKTEDSAFSSYREAYAKSVAEAQSVIKIDELKKKVALSPNPSLPPAIPDQRTFDELEAERSRDASNFKASIVQFREFDNAANEMILNINSNYIILHEEYDDNPELDKLEPSSPNQKYGDNMGSKKYPNLVAVRAVPGLIRFTPLAKSVRREIKDTQKDLLEIVPGWFHTGTKHDLPKNACYVGRYKDRYAWVCPDGLPGLSKFTVNILKFSDLIKERTVLTVPGGPRFTPSAGR